MSRRSLLTVLALAAALGGLVLPRLLRRAPTDEERILTLFHEAARAAEERRIGDVVRDVSAGFAGQGLDRQGLRQLVALQVLRGAWVSVTVAGARVAVQGEAARAAVDVVLSRSGKGRPLAEVLPEQASVYRLGLRLDREGEGWKVVAADWRPISLEEAAAGPELGADPSAPPP